MKRKILIFALCCIMLFGVFSVSVFAASPYETTKFTFNEVTSYGGSKTINISFTSNGKIFRQLQLNNYSADHAIRYLETETNSFITVYTYSGGWLSEDYRTIELTEGTFNDKVSSTLLDALSNIGTFDVVHEHSYTSSVISPTHTAQGYTIYTCAECGDSYQDNYVAALGHNYTITEKVDPSCTTKGYTTYVCDCGSTYTEEGAAYGHTFTTTTVDPTCTKKGSITYVCDCGYSYSEDIPTLPHNYSSSVVDPTCSRKGYTMYTCECGYSYRDNYVDTIPHVFEGTRCSVCNAIDPSYIIKSKDFSNVFVRLSEQIKVNTVVGVLCVAAAACVGLVFMWWGGRKLVRALMAAFKKGKISF